MALEPLPAARGGIVLPDICGESDDMLRLALITRVHTVRIKDLIVLASDMP